MKKILTILLCVACFACQDNSQEKALLKREKELLEQKEALLQRERDMMHREKENATSTVEEKIYDTTPVQEAPKVDAYSEEVGRAKEVVVNIQNYVTLTTEQLQTDCLFGGGSVVVRLTNTTPRNLECAMGYVSVWRQGKEVLRQKDLVRFENIASGTSQTQKVTFQRGCEVEVELVGIQSNYLGMNTLPVFPGNVEGNNEYPSVEELKKSVKE